MARQLYENEAIIKHFTERFWICISDNFSVKRVLSVIFEKLTGRKCELSNTEDIIERVHQLVRGKRYLLVLDDVWDQYQNKWSSIKNSLRRIGGSTGSMVLVTTRNTDVAKTAESRYLHQLTGLSDEESWAFFVQKAFLKGGIATYNPGLEDIGRKIVKKCKGLPLAINVIGGLLRMKEDPCEWKTIEKSRMWNLPQENNDILPSLLLSYNNLSSPSLKQCFAYFAIYPKECLVDREDLINLWNAQGFLHCQSEGSNLTPEELGGTYVDILLSNSLLQAETRHSSDCDVTEYRIHYLVHDMALYISRHDWLIWKGVDKVGNPYGCRHLAIYSEGDDVITSESSAEKMARLRTLHSIISLPANLLVHAKNLRVLKLAATGLKEVPTAIGELTHLRYIDLSHNPIVMLPDSITSLHHLQTFRLFSYKFKKLPQRLYRLVNLRHLHLTSHSWCLPRGISRLKALQTLPMLELNEGHGWEIGELGALSDIKGLLSVSGLEHVKSKEDAEKAGICKKAGISEMQLSWGWGRTSNHLDVLDALCPPPNLKLLMITGYDGPKFPSWMMTFSDATLRPFFHLVHIELLYCTSCQQLPALGKLPCLRDLSMYSMWSVTNIGDEFYHSSNDVKERTPTVFPALKKLTVSSFENLTEWEPPLSCEFGTVTAPPTVAFPLLEILKIEQCHKLVQTPTNFPSLRHLWVNKSLKGLELYNVINGSSNALTSLNINEAPELYGLPDELINCTNLEELTIRCCPDLQSLPDGLGTQLTSLIHLSVIECPELKQIPATMGDCHSLKRLCIRDCHNIQGMPDLSQLNHIEEVEINGCRKLKCLPILIGLQALPLLNSLSIGGLESLEIESSSSVMSSQLVFPALKLLRIIKDDCTKQLPEWIGSLSSMQKLEIKWCENLMHLPSQNVMLQMTRLTALIIESCPLLQEKCAKKDDPEWHKISHIRLISINSNIIQEMSA